MIKNESKPVCGYIYPASAFGVDTCEDCGHPVSKHQRQDPVNRPGSIRLTPDDPGYASGPVVVREGFDQTESQGGNMQALMARMAGEFLASTALSTIQADINAQRRQLEAFVKNVHDLNVQLGDFRAKQVEPIKRELEYLRYNLGDRSTTVLQTLEVLTSRLGRTLEAGGTRIPEDLANAPSMQELLASGVKANEAVEQGSFTLIEQNKRLLEEIEKLREENTSLKGRLAALGRRNRAKKGKRRAG